MTPGGSSSPLRSLATFSSVIFSSTAIWREVISSISSICSLMRGSLSLKRMRFKDKEPRINEQIDEIEEMTSRQIAVLEKITAPDRGARQDHRREGRQAAQGRRTAARRH